jgi:hypothetical protein
MNSNAHRLQIEVTEEQLRGMNPRGGVNAAATRPSSIRFPYRASFLLKIKVAHSAVNPRLYTVEVALADCRFEICRSPKRYIMF